MIGTVNGMITYYNLLKSPLKSYEEVPITNILYGAIVTQKYSPIIEKNIKSTMSTYFNSLNSNISSLKATAQALENKEKDNSLIKNSINSSGGSAITGKASYNATLGEHTISVSKLATVQVNDGAKLKSYEKSFRQGTNTISINVSNSETKNISFDVKEDDNNKTSLEKMSNSINSSKMGLTARVVSDPKTSTSYISIVSDKTGKSSTFTLNDIEGDMVEVSGANSKIVKAEDAKYTLDGKEYSSENNSISMDDGKAQLILNKADGKDIKFSISRDVSTIKQDIKDLVDNYNEVINLANSSSSNIYSSSSTGAKRLQYEFGSLMNENRDSLKDIGITISSDKTLSINDSLLDKSLKEDFNKVKDIFTGVHGISKDIISKSNEVNSSPLKYMNSYDVSYNSRHNLQYAKNMYAGLTLDYYR